MTPWSLCVVSLVSNSSGAESGVICSPLRKTIIIFYVVEPGIDEYSCIIPRVRFDTTSLMKFLFAIVLAVCSHKTDQQSVRNNLQLQNQNEWQKHTHYVYSSARPLDQMTYLAGGLISDSLLLLNIIKNNRGVGAE